MIFKVLSVTLFALFVSEAIFAHKPNHRRCIGIETAKDFNIMELDGTIWFVQGITNIGNRIPVDCTRGSYSSPPDKKSLSHTMHYKKKGSTQYRTYDWQITQSNSSSFFMQVLGDDKLNANAFVAYKSPNMIVIGMCFHKNGKFRFEDAVVWTKDREVDKKKIEKEVRDSGIPVRDYFDVTQDQTCSN